MGLNYVTWAKRSRTGGVLGIILILAFVILEEEYVVQGKYASMV